MNQSNAFGTNKKLLMLSSDQMNRTSWGCEGVFLWCYGYVFMFVMWQEVVTCGGGGCCQMMAPGGAMCKLKVGGGWWRKKWRKKYRRGREEPLHNKQTSLPPPASHAHVLQLLVIKTPEELLTAVAWKVSAVRVAGEANLQILKALRICFNLGAADTKCHFSKPLLFHSTGCTGQRHTCTHFISGFLSVQIWFGAHDGSVSIHWQKHISLLSGYEAFLLCIEICWLLLALIVFLSESQVFSSSQLIHVS